MNSVAAVVVAAHILSAGAFAASEGNRLAPIEETGCTIRIASSPPEEEPRAHAFDAASALDLHIEIAFLAPEVPETMDVRLHTPRGHLYQTMAVTRDQPVASIPVAGTLIARHSLYGRWRLEARSPDGTARCNTYFGLSR